MMVTISYMLNYYLGNMLPYEKELDIENNIHK